MVGPSTRSNGRRGESRRTPENEYPRETGDSRTQNLPRNSHATRNCHRGKRPVKLTGRIDCMTKLCSIPDCGNKHIAKGFCGTHYMRCKRHGDPNTVSRERGTAPLDGLCTIEGCGNEHHSRGFCGTHYERWRKHGNPNTVLFGTDNITYKGAHDRVRSQRGPAKYQLCQHCEAPAEQWAYNHNSERERTQEILDRNGKPTVVAYSPNPTDYLSLCHVCHIKFDKGVTAA